MNRWNMNPGDNCYFVTAAIIERQNIFIALPFYHEVIRDLQYCCTTECHLHGYVIMPDHAHFILSTDSPGMLAHSVSHFMQRTSGNIISLLEEMNRYEVLEVFHRAEEHEECGVRHSVWQEKYHLGVIDTGDIFRQTLDSLHKNPVRKGFVEQPEHWRWSSARNYILNDHSLIQIECLAQEEFNMKNKK